MITLSEIIKTLQSVYNKYDSIKIGLAGSYANNTARLDSDIDVVIAGDSMQVDIAEYIKGLFSIPVDILWLELLKEDDEELDRYALSIGVPKNENSPTLPLVDVTYVSGFTFVFECIFQSFSFLIILSYPSLSIPLY